MKETEKYGQNTNIMKMKNKNMFTKQKYYHLRDLQNGGHLMASGRNSKTLKDLKEGLLSYLSGDHTDKEIKKLNKMTVHDIAEMYEFHIETTNYKHKENY